MKIEQDVAIHHVIQRMRSVRPSIIPNKVNFANLELEIS